MEKLATGLKEVQEAYSGPEGVLWELVMGEQIHIGGFAESMVLAEKAGIKEGQKVLDLCSALGGGLRFLKKNFKIDGYGVDGTQHMVDEAIKRSAAEGLDIEYKTSDVCDIPYEDNTFDVVWGEDAWCYVDDKEKLINEAARVLKPGGILAFSDWMEGSQGLSNEEATRINTFMKFPYMETLNGYSDIIATNGLSVTSTEDLNEHFGDCIELYINMLTKQLTYDALKIIGDNMEMMQAMGGEMANMLEMARAGKFTRGRIIATK